MLSRRFLKLAIAALPCIIVIPFHIKYYVSYYRKSYIAYDILFKAVLLMPGKYEEIIYKVLCDEPVTPNEIALKLKITQKTAQKTLMQLALTKRDVKYKNSGRIHLFWKRPSENIITKR